MRAFFNNRRNRVKPGSNFAASEWKHVEKGYPQGSSFGPLIWNLFQNDMATTVTNSNLHMYADDYQLYKVGNQIQSVVDESSTEMDVVSNWYKKIFLKPSIKNTKLSPNQARANSNGLDSFTLRNDYHSITFYDKLKILGINFDNTYDFSKHISNVSTKCNQKVGELMGL